MHPPCGAVGEAATSTLWRHVWPLSPLGTGSAALYAGPGLAAPRAHVSDADKGRALEGPVYGGLDVCGFPGWRWCFVVSNNGESAEFDGWFLVQACACVLSFLCYPATCGQKGHGSGSALPKQRWWHFYMTLSCPRPTDEDRS